MDRYKVEIKEIQAIGKHTEPICEFYKTKKEAKRNFDVFVQLMDESVYSITISCIYPERIIEECKHGKVSV